MGKTGVTLMNCGSSAQGQERGVEKLGLSRVILRHAKPVTATRHHSIELSHFDTVATMVSSIQVYYLV